MPAASDHAEHGAKYSREKTSTGEEEIEILFNIRLTAADSYEGAVDGS